MLLGLFPWFHRIRMAVACSPRCVLTLLLFVLPVVLGCVLDVVRKLGVSLKQIALPELKMV